VSLATFIQTSAHDLAAIADGTVQAIVTSSPYYGLRVYAGEQGVEWPAVEYAPMPGLPTIRIAGCDPDCVHEWQDGPTFKHGQSLGGPSSTLSGSQKYGESVTAGATNVKMGAYCAKCGGWRGGLGNEPTLEAFIGHLILCLREWRRVLRDDGICFVNLGDSFSGSGGAGGDYNEGGLRAGQPKFKAGKSNGLKPKDLMMVPARFALAAQADGWWLRSDIIGHKIAPMPESVTDRPTRSHEHIFMLTKASRYFWDAEAVKEVATNEGKIVQLGAKSFSKGQANGAGIAPTGNGAADTYTVPAGRNMRDVIEWRPSPFNAASKTVRWERAQAYDGGDDTYCKVSLNCSVHGDWFAQVARAQGGVRADGEPSRNRRIGDYLFEGQEGDYVPIDRLLAAGFQVESLGYSHQQHSLSATDHSKRSHRTGRAPATSQPCIASAQTADHTDGMLESPLFAGMPLTHKDDSNISAASAAHVPAIDAFQTSCRNGDMHTASVDSACVPPLCTCQLYRKVANDATNHFAVWPEAIPEKLIRASTSERGCCPACGAPWVRVVERGGQMPVEESPDDQGRMKANGQIATDTARRKQLSGAKHAAWKELNPDITLGFAPSCVCPPADPTPCVVLDPFSGSGTTAKVAVRLGRRAIGVDIASEYLNEVTALRFGEGVQMELVSA
jgi:hypothetical protein